MITKDQSQTSHSPQIKICGLMNQAEAVACSSLGADAIGYIFYPKSPRFVSAKQAEKISLALPESVMAVGVFVNESFDDIMRTAETARLHVLQLHGDESPDLVFKLKEEGLPVIKALFIHRSPFYNQAFQFNADAFLVECGSGPLPGGNARTWDVATVQHFSERYPLVLAGGLSIQNIEAAITQSRPDAVDVSSSIESRPGQKDLEKVKTLISKVRGINIDKPLRRVFNGHNEPVKRHI